MRRGEILRLRREDIDFENGAIYVVDRGGESFGDFADRDGLKTEGSEAPVGMPDHLHSVLKKWLENNPSQWVFPNVPDTGPWREGSPGAKPLDRLRAAFARAGVEHGNFQGCRQTWATMGESLWGFQGPLIRRQLRHADERTTRGHYMKADVANLASAVRTIGFDGRAYARKRVSPARSRQKKARGRLASIVAAVAAIEAQIKGLKIQLRELVADLAEEARSDDAQDGPNLAQSEGEK